MKKVILIALVLCAVSAAGRGLSDYENVTRLRLVGDPDFKSVGEVNARWAYGRPFTVETFYESSRDTGKYYLIICNGELYRGISSVITEQYVPQLEYEGYTVTVEVVTEPYTRATDVDLRNHLADFYAENGYFYLLLVGDLPVPFYEMYFDDEWGYEYFPIDLFYMDLDGEWVDADANGLWDDHIDGSGDMYADIPVGRWTAGPLNFYDNTETELIQNYITKNLAYRTGGNPCTERALCYVDDDWTPWGPEWAGDMGLAYDDVTAVYDPGETYAEDYEDRLDDDYEFIQVCAHSYWLMHQFEQYGEYANTWFYEVYDIKPKALFYNLFACSNARYTEDNYMGGWYTFMDNDYGLAAVGSTKTGAMLNFYDFYNPLGANYSIGESFRWWMELWADAGGESRPWHYGMTLIGDPTLYIGQFTDITIVSFDAAQKGDAVALRWEYTADESVLGFNLYREETVYKDDRRIAAFRARLNDEPITGSSPMVYVDDTVAPDVSYTYTLEPVTDGPGFAPMTVEITTLSPAKTTFCLAAPYPNPARSEVNFGYSIPETATDGVMLIYDLKGRTVRTLEPAAGSGVVVWDLCDAAGREVAPGIYITRLSAGHETAVRKVVVLK